MKLGQVTNLEKRNKKPSKKMSSYVISKNYDAIVIFRIYGEFGAICKPDSGRIVDETNIFIKSNLLSYTT